MSITITIVIDGKDVSVATASPESIIGISPQTSDLLGAQNGGSAPSSMEFLGGAGFSSTPISGNVPVVKVGGISAGSAPSFPPP
jgi:hypothetical protein